MITKLTASKRRRRKKIKCTGVCGVCKGKRWLRYRYLTWHCPKSWYHLSKQKGHRDREKMREIGCNFLHLPSFMRLGLWMWIDLFSSILNETEGIFHHFHYTNLILLKKINFSVSTHLPSHPITAIVNHRQVRLCKWQNAGQNEWWRHLHTTHIPSGAQSKEWILCVRISYMKLESD